MVEVARVVFEETRESRRKLHRVRGALGCDATFDTGGTFVTSGGCPCVDEYIDAVVAVWQYLSRHSPDTVRSYAALARTHCRQRVVKDVHRKRRGARTQQRTDRLADGAIGQALRTDQQRVLLRHLVEEAASAAPLENDAQLMRRLADLRANEFGGTADAHLGEIMRDLPVVREAAVTHGRCRRDDIGRLVSWWESYVEVGLGWRERLSTVTIVTTDDEADRVVDFADPREAARADLAHDTVIIDVFVDVAQSRSSNDRLTDTVRAALTTLVDRGVLDHATVDRVVADPQRLDEAAHAARDLVGGGAARVA